MDPEYIKAEIHRLASSLFAVAEAAGLHNSTTRKALRRRCYAGEQAIAGFLGRKPRYLWPDRYERDGAPKHPRIASQRSKRTGRESRQKRRAA